METIIRPEYISAFSSDDINISEKLVFPPKNYLMPYTQGRDRNIYWANKKKVSTNDILKNS